MQLDEYVLSMSMCHVVSGAYEPPEVCTLRCCVVGWIGAKIYGCEIAGLSWDEVIEMVLRYLLRFSCKSL